MQNMLWLWHCLLSAVFQTIRYIPILYLCPMLNDIDISCMACMQWIFLMRKTRIVYIMRAVCARGVRSTASLGEEEEKHRRNATESVQNRIGESVLGGEMGFEFTVLRRRNISNAAPFHFTSC